MMSSRERIEKPNANRFLVFLLLRVPESICGKHCWLFALNNFEKVFAFERVKETRERSSEWVALCGHLMRGQGLSRAGMKDENEDAYMRTFERISDADAC